MSVICSVIFGAKESGGKIYCVINRACLAALNYPAYITFMLLCDGRLIVQAGEKGKPFAVKAAIGAKEDALKIGGKALTDLVYGGMGWNKNKVYSASGTYAGVPAVVTFDLKEAEESNA